jgi:hypothetical protein
MKNEEVIKKKIVDGYKRGVCDHTGKTIPQERRSRNWKGSHFMAAKTDQWYENFDKIEWCK